MSMKNCLKSARLNDYLTEDVLDEITECLKSAPMTSILRVNTLIATPPEALQLAQAHFLQVLTPLIRLSKCLLAEGFSTAALP